MRLLLTTDTVGGVWTFTRELTAELLQLGHSVALVSLGRTPRADHSRWCEAIALSYPDDFRYDASEAPLEWMEANDSAYAQAEPLMVRVVREFAPDVLHSSQFCFGKLPVLIPKVTTAHSDVLSWAEACWPDGLEDSPWLARYRELVQDGLDGADAVVAPTQWMLGALGRNFVLPRKSRVIMNGRTIAPQPSTEPRQMRAVSVGRLWDEGKNVAILGGLDSPFPILLAGDERWEKMCAPSGEKVSSVGALAESDLLLLFLTSSVYIAPSIYEPFGLAPLEAALCGCAVVANDIPPLREVWGDAALYFCDAGSLELLLRLLYDSPEALDAARLRSRERARQLTASRMAKQYIAQYEELLSKRAATGRISWHLERDFETADVS